MLFICHQMAMEREAKMKKTPPQTPPTPPYQQRPPIYQSVIKDSNVPIIWILGGPGTGKGLQSDKIVKKYNFSHFSTGDLLREEVASGSEKGKQLQEIMKTGGLVSNEEVLGLLENAMIKVINSTVGYLVDGYPREKDQGAAFEKYIAPVDLILYFECSADTMVKRVMYRASQSAVVRADDNEETIKSRIHTFSTHTESILCQYPDRVKRINAERAPEVIFAEAETYIDALLTKKGPMVKTAAVATN